MSDTTSGSTSNAASGSASNDKSGSTNATQHDAADGASGAAFWWTAFGSDVLNGLVEQALANNFDVQAARHRLASAHASNSKAWAAFWPNASFRVQGARDASARDNYMQVGLDVLWPLALPVERQGASRLAQSHFDMAQANQGVARATVAAEVVRTWLQATHVARTLAAEKSALASATVSMNYLAHRVRAGLLADAAAVDARLQADERRRRIATAGATLHELSQTLALLVGQATPDPAWFSAVRPASAAGTTGGAGTPQEAGIAQGLRTLQTAGTPLIERVPSAWLAQRQDVAMARAQVVQAAGHANLAQAALYPRVMLGLSWIYAKNLTGNVRHRNEAEPMVAPFIDIPLWDWGTRLARRDAQALALKAAVSDYQQVLLTAYAETEIALQALASWRQVSALSQRAVDEHQRVWQRVQASAHAGLTDKLDVEDARRRLQDAEIQRSASLVGEQLAFSALHRNRQVGVPK